MTGHYIIILWNCKELYEFVGVSDTWRILVVSEIYVTKSSMPEKDEYYKEIEELWTSHFLTNMGVKHQKLRQELQKYLGVNHIELMCNGHMALELAIQALKLEGEVITTPFTFISTTHAIVRNGLKPVFCDINADDYTMDVNKIESLITDNTSAILPVHVYGHVCNVEAIERIAKKHELKVIYDAAHAFGVTYKGRGVGSYGDVSMFSFHATKVFNTIEGGAVCYHDEKYGEELYRLKNFGIRSEEVIDGIGANAKMNEFQAAMGICNLRHVNKEIAKRKKVVEKYRERLQNKRGLVLPLVQKDVTANYAYFPVLFDEKEFGYTRDAIYNRLKESKVHARKYFYPLTNGCQCYKGRFDVKKTPVAQYVSDRILTLPLYADLSLDVVDMICDIICEFL